MAWRSIGTESRLQIAFGYCRGSLTNGNGNGNGYGDSYGDGSGYGEGDEDGDGESVQ